MILAGVDYTGLPTAQWVSHVRLVIEEDIRRRVGTRVDDLPVYRWSPHGTAARMDGAPGPGKA